MTVSVDAYLAGLLARYAVNPLGAKAAAQTLYPLIQSWAGNNLLAAEFSGSLAKGTAVSIATDADVLLSLSSVTPCTLADMYDSLWRTMTAAGLGPRRQNVSIGVQVSGYSIDLVPARRQSQWGEDHSLYRNKANSWTKTNVNAHIAHIAGSGRVDEIRILKIWRERQRLELPSFVLELATIDALRYARHGQLAANVVRVLEHLRDEVQTVRYIDPANTNNVVSDDCTGQEKYLIALAAATSLQKRWAEIVW